MDSLTAMILGSVVSLVCLGIIIYAGHLGGKLVYEHGVGVPVRP